jgi:hypothetical protein
VLNQFLHLRIVTPESKVFVLKVANRSFANVAKFEYSRRTVKNQNYTDKEIKSMVTIRTHFDGHGLLSNNPRPVWKEFLK